ncbi:hypothetical protein ONV78_20610 [Hahella sp. CR1]|uniref:imm11 family protein n=1 Tax=Hahella sp. CR1 TaxID=2992807 RepID=UPI0024417757|nr:DUF1629 domain-containing protein [Hahella sp. CR1]MDG9670151.1 hypothetical protein [Hahella sp. CR1]
MTLYAIYADQKKYQYVGFDYKQIISEFGDSKDTRFDANRSHRSYKDIWKNPIGIYFGSDKKGLLIPDISEHQGRLFLSEKAYDVLKDIIDQDGEFLPVVYDGSKGFMFNTLRLAEDLEALDETQCEQDEYDDVMSIGFHEGKLQNVSIFRAKFDRFYVAYCTQEVKDAIEKAGLKGLLFYSDLRRPWQADVNL